MTDELINELSYLCGIAPEYYDIFGERHAATLETKRAILAAMGLKIETEHEITDEINRRRLGAWKDVTESAHVISVNSQPFKIPVYLPLEKGAEAAARLNVSVEDESGSKDNYIIPLSELSAEEEKYIDGLRYLKYILTDRGDRAIGYYTLTIKSGESDKCAKDDGLSNQGDNYIFKESRIIIAPDACYIPLTLEKGRGWGFSLNLYSIRSSENWGVGDFNDLRKIISWSASLNADLIGINPLHAIPNTSPYGASPYLPISRLYKNFIYLDIEDVPEVIETDEIMGLITSSGFSAGLMNLREAAFIDYDGAALLKERIMRQAFDVFYKRHYIKKTRRGAQFERYAEDEGEALESFALYMSLWGEMKRSKSADSWRQWTPEYRDRNPEAVRRFRQANNKEILYFKYVQWLIDEQLKGAASDACISGMSIGLYHDIAVGSSGSGSDCWNYRDVFGAVSVGAPPDDFSINGQDWGFPPMLPEKLKQTGYSLFIQIIRKNMKNFGAVRIDHALGLFRLFWIPRGAAPCHGAYVYYPSEDLLRIIALESVRNKTIVIAEDLGTVGEDVKKRLMEFRMLSYRLFYFERNYPELSFRSPEQYPEMSLCAIATHDLPTLYGYWAGQDIKMRRQIGVYREGYMFDRHMSERERDKALIIEALRYHGLLPTDYPSDAAMTIEMNHQLCAAIYKYLAMTKCKLVLVGIDDIIGTLNQQNMPGTIDEHPNWVQKMPLLLDDIITDRRFKDISNINLRC
ncbi:MAG: 4-alpha-glucanotransferase [Nitrospirae bacterium]|nr:4-alpha-glucanotransferase [Nitrospirota bacterium]